MKSARAPAKTQIRLLCFGASITAGWNAFGLHYYPYATRLSARLADELPTSHFSIDVDGSPGDTVLHGQYISRLDKNMATAKVPYDWVIIQAGGNDLAWNSTPEAIYEKIKTVWNIPLKAGAKVMALTVTEHAHSSPIMKAKWENLNSMVSNHDQDGFYVADVAKAIPWTEMGDEDRKKIWGKCFSQLLVLPASLRINTICIWNTAPKSCPD